MGDLDDVIIFDSKMYETLEDPESENESGTRRKRSGSKSFVRNTKMHFPKISDEERARLMGEYQYVVVHDFGDEFHMTDEQRRKTQKYYEYQVKISKLKNKYNRLDEYVKAYRINIEALKAIAEDVMLYSKEDFIEKVLKGEITVTGLKIPVYNGKGRKTINWEVVSEYIADTTLDPKDLLTNKDDFDLPNLSDEELIEILFEKDELEDIVRAIEDDVSGDHDTQPSTEDVEDPETGEFIVQEASKSSLKQLMKANPTLMREFISIVKNNQRSKKLRDKLSSYTFDVVQDDFEEIADIDSEYGYESISDVPEFKGDILNDDDYLKYMHALDVYRDNIQILQSNGKFISQADIDDEAIKSILSDAGWNVRKLYEFGNEQKRLKKSYKMEAKRMNKLREKLTSLELKHKNHKSELEFNSHSKKKKKKKGDD